MEAVSVSTPRDDNDQDDVITTSPPSRILFGSCNSQHYDQTLWPLILSRNASAFVWGGDSIYADDVDFRFESRPSRFIARHVPSSWTVSSSWLLSALTTRCPRPATPQFLQELFRAQTQDKGYQQVLESNMTILGILDDHDFGRNNGDKNYPFRAESAATFVSFLQHKNDATNLTLFAQRAAAGKGVYGVKVFDFTRTTPLLSDEDAGLDPAVPRTTTLSNQSVAIFLLDIRSNKTPWPKEWKKDVTADFLGAEQWEWLEASLRRSTAAVNMVVSGLQVHSDRFFHGNAVEDWSQFPSAQHRLYQALLQPNVQAPIIVSGDVHMAELLRKDCRRRRANLNDTSFGPPRLLLEVTTSGMTHSWGTRTCAHPHFTATCQSDWFQYSLSKGMHLAHHNGAWTDVVIDKSTKEGAKTGLQYTLERNFGEFEFDWDRRQVIVRIFGEEFGKTKKPLLRTVWDFDTLSGRNPILSRVPLQQFSQMPSLPSSLPEDWICVNHRGHQTVWHKAYGFVSSVGTACFLAFLPFTLPAIMACYLMRQRRHSSYQNYQNQNKLINCHVNGNDTN